MYERFSERARKVMQLANQEAQRLHQEYIGTDHLLLGLAKEGFGGAASVLKNLGIDLGQIRREVEKIALAGPDLDALMGKLPQTPSVKKVIEYSIAEARHLNHYYVGTEHLLLGLMLAKESVAAYVLKHLGLELEDVREEVLNILGHCFRPEEEAAPYQPDPYEAFQHWPPPALQELKDRDEGIEELLQKKEIAIAEQDWEKAAHLRDQIEGLRKKLLGLREKWQYREAILTKIRLSESALIRALAAGILQGEWAALPLLCEALEKDNDPRAAMVREWLDLPK